MRLLIGRKYEQEFNSAFLLIRGCSSLSEYKISGALENGSAEIAYGVNTYRYDASIENAQFYGADIDNEGIDQGFTVWGATWFSKLRGEQARESADALWLDFMKNLADLYHNKHAILTYEPQNGQTIDVLDVEPIAYRFLRAFHPAFYGVADPSRHPSIRVEPVTGKSIDDTKDIYCLSLRLSLNCGGQSEYVIGKIYFSQYLQDMRPMPFASAVALDRQLSSMQTSANKKVNYNQSSFALGEEETNLTNKDMNARDNALKALGSCINGTIEGKDNFLDYLVMGDQRDIRTVTRLLSRTTDSTHELQCDGVKVLCISHLQWKSSLFNVYINNSKALRFSFDLGDVLTVKCINCYTRSGDDVINEILVMDNEVLLKNAEGEIAQSVRLRSLSADDFGISKEETELIRSQSLLNDHIKVRSCSLEALGVGDSTCNCIRCASQLFSVYYNAKGVIVDEPSLAKREEIICKECKYPEKVYYNPLNGSRDLTASLVLDVNSMNLVRRDRANQCSCCKRHYVGDDATCNVCGLVNRVVKSAPNSNLAEKKKAKALYKQYASVLPVLLRATYWGKKYCFEDDGIIVFVVGNRKYRFDKVNASPTGFIDSVKRMYR